MLIIMRTHPIGGLSIYNEASVVIRDEDNNDIPGLPPIVFSLKTYSKIAAAAEPIGDLILLHINLFFETMDLSTQKRVYEMYRY